jgi:hypothetical protein
MHFPRFLAGTGGTPILSGRGAGSTGILRSMSEAVEVGGMELLDIETAVISLKAFLCTSYFRGSAHWHKSCLLHRIPFGLRHRLDESRLFNEDTVRAVDHYLADRVIENQVARSA